MQELSRRRAMPIPSACCVTDSRSTRSPTKTASSRRSSSASARPAAPSSSSASRPASNATPSSCWWRAGVGSGSRRRRSLPSKSRTHFGPISRQERASRCSQSLVTAENINTLFEQAGMSGEIDLLSHRHRLQRLLGLEGRRRRKPRVVRHRIQRHSAPACRSPCLISPIDAGDGTNYFGASLEALVRLGSDKGYRIVGCNISGSNAFSSARISALITSLSPRPPRSTTSRRAISMPRSLAVIARDRVLTSASSGRRP